MKLNLITFALISVSLCFFGQAQAAETTAAPESSSVVAGTGSVKFNGLFQTWLINDSTGTLGKPDFKVRRAEMRFSGSVTENTRWFVLFDPAKSLTPGAVVATNDNKILQDVGVAFEFAPGFEIVMGQFKTPTMAEGLDSPAEIIVFEKAYVTRAFGDRREPGAMLTYKTDAWKFAAMASNGQATNVDDPTNAKDLSLRADYTATDTLKLGAFTTASNFKYSERARWGANARYTWDSLSLRLEGGLGRELGVKSTGWAGDVAYQLGERFQPVVRVDGFSTAGNSSLAATVGLNYFLLGHHSKIQAAYTQLNDMLGRMGSYAPAQGTNGGMLTLAFQAAI